MNEQVKRLLVRRLTTELEVILSKHAAKKVAEQAAANVADEVITLITGRLNAVLGQDRAAG